MNLIFLYFFVNNTYRSLCNYLCFSVSQYNSNFELPEDCKNMSFSELFDQELFSTNGNI